MLLHEIFQRGLALPHEVYNAPDGAKRFMYASMIVRMEDEKAAEGG